MCTQLKRIQKASYLKTELPIKTGKIALNTDFVFKNPWTLSFRALVSPLTVGEDRTLKFEISERFHLAHMPPPVSCCAQEGF